MKRLFSLICMALSLTTLLSAAPKDRDKFINDLMSRMTLEEKLGQLNLLPAGKIETGHAINSPIAKLIAEGKLGSILNAVGQDNIRELQDIAIKKSRLGIPLMVGLDVIHGYKTIFPIPLALACTWNIPAIENAARIAAKEATADGVSWNYSPMVDISLDARWGRIAESNGEDPYLGSLIAAALVRGYQGNYGKENLMACLKHFALYGASESGRDYNTVDMSHLRMYNQYFPPYKAAVEAGVGSVMTSFNIIDGKHATTNRWLLDDVLRKEWGFKGFIVTDYNSIGELVKHGLAKDKAEGGVKALKAGTDMDMCTQSFIGTLKESLAKGLVTQEEIDQACRRVLIAKWEQGLFEDGYRYCDKKRRARDIYTHEHLKAARDLAAESFVLLKNDNNLLPLKKQGRIALIGPLANDRANLAGNWAGCQEPDRHATILESMQKYLQGKATVTYAQGCNIYDDSLTQYYAERDLYIKRGDATKMLNEAIALAKSSDIIVCTLGEVAEMSGESSSRADLAMPDAQARLLKALAEVGKPIVLLNFAGRPTDLSWEAEHLPAIMNVWFGGSETGAAICDVLFGDKAPGGRLAVSMPRTTGQEPLYYNHLNGGRPRPYGSRFKKFSTGYVETLMGPLYPFGYGLSYTTFQYGKPTLSATSMTENGTITLSVTVTNTGQREATEVVQLYIRDLVASISRPIKELKGFERISLKAGETREVKFAITADMLKFYNSDLKYVCEPGEFELMVGANSCDVQTVKFELK